jgi:hypothetical protein
MKKMIILLQKEVGEAALGSLLLRPRERSRHFLCSSAARALRCAALLDECHLHLFCGRWRGRRPAVPAGQRQQHRRALAALRALPERALRSVRRLHARGQRQPQRAQ